MLWLRVNILAVLSESFHYHGLSGNLTKWKDLFRPPSSAREESEAYLQNLAFPGDSKYLGSSPFLVLINTTQKRASSSSRWPACHLFSKHHRCSLPTPTTRSWKHVSQSSPLSFSTAGLKKWPWSKTALTTQKACPSSWVSPLVTWQMDDLAVFNLRVFILSLNGNWIWQYCQFTRTDCGLEAWHYPDSTCLKWNLSGDSGSWYLCWQEVHGSYCFSICSCISEIVPTFLNFPV